MFLDSRFLSKGVTHKRKATWQPDSLSCELMTGGWGLVVRVKVNFGGAQLSLTPHTRKLRNDPECRDSLWSDHNKDFMVFNSEGSGRMSRWCCR